MVTRNMLTRRDLTVMLAAAGAALALRPLRAFAQETVPVVELAKPGPLGDVALGPETAKVTIIEYASMTCTHCQHFHEVTWPELKKRYIDTNQVRFILREFPLDPLAQLAFMVARCSGNDKYYAVTDMLFDTQRSWAFVNKPVDALQQVMKQTGMSADKFQSCRLDKSLYEAVEAVRSRGADVLKIDSTPTFFINGQRFVGALSIEDIEKAVKPILGA